jgi:choline dehydrogenase-like flavoprotein
VRRQGGRAAASSTAPHHRRARGAADVCVIGSGAGGAVVAKELAEAGARVVLLEEGAQHSAGEFTARPRDMLPKLYRDAAQHATIGRPPILLPAREGGRRHDARQLRHLLPHARHVLARWRDEFGSRTSRPRRSAPHFARVEETLNVVPVPPELAGANAHVAKRGADALGLVGRTSCAATCAAASAPACAPTAARRTRSSTSASPTSRRPTPRAPSPTRA